MVLRLPLDPRKKLSNLSLLCVRVHSRLFLERKSVNVFYTSKMLDIIVPK